MMVLLIALTVGCLVALAFHYVGYPALLWVLATIWPRPVRYGSACPSASLIIAAYNEEAVIREKIENSLSLDYPNLQILVVSAGSTVAAVGEMLAIRRHLVKPLPPGLINDDAYLGLSVLRQGYRVIYEPQAFCWEAPTLSVQDELTRRRRITAGHYQLVFRMKW